VQRVAAPGVERPLAARSVLPGARRMRRFVSASRKSSQDSQEGGSCGKCRKNKNRRSDVGFRSIQPPYQLAPVGAETRKSFDDAPYNFTPPLEGGGLQKFLLFI